MDEARDETRWNIHRFSDVLLRAQEAMVDEGKDWRLKRRQCPWCFYFGSRGKLAGSGFTDYVCQNCCKELSWHNTATPKYCFNCCDEFGLCVECGGFSWDVELCEEESCTNFQHVLVKKKKICGFHSSAPEYKRCKKVFLD